MLEITQIHPLEAGLLLELRQSDPPEYAQHFTALPLSGEEFFAILSVAKEDKYWWIKMNAQVVGLIMLRGMDAGFSTPAFGVYVRQAFGRRGLGQLALTFAMTWCRLHGKSSLMLSVSEENEVAIRIYEKAGFVSQGERTSKGHLIYRKYFGRH